jgi:hypothetical protein
LVSINDIVKRALQQVQDGAPLLGLSAGHLYPDMVVHGRVTKEVNLEDPLVNSGGIITMGLEIVADHNQGICWSLQLVSRPETRGGRTRVVPIIQNTKLRKEEKRKEDLWELFILSPAR